MSDLDELGRRHAENVRASFADAEPPPIDSLTRRHGRLSRRGVWTALASAAVVFVVLLPVALLTDGTTRSGQTPVGGTSVGPSTVSTEAVTTSSTSTNAGPVSSDVPRLGSAVPEGALPIQVVEDAVLNVDGSCVTAETADETILLVWGFGEASVLGPEVRIQGFDPGIPPRVLSSGARYELRGVPDPFEAELAEPPPVGCEYDERLILLGVLDAPVGHGLTTHPVEVLEAFPSIGSGPTGITIDGACATISHPNGELLVVWPAATVSLLDDKTIHMSRWEALAELVVTSGDTVSLQGYESDRPADNPPPGCEHDGTFWTGFVSLAQE